MAHRLSMKYMLDRNRFFNHADALFLDRDGVINRFDECGYVLSPERLEFVPGAIDAIVKANSYFNRVFVVTNQQCVDRGMITHEGLASVHDKLVDAVVSSGGCIDKIYYSPFVSEANHPWRKPNIGMALQAKKDFSDVRLKNCIMVGDSMSDMLFGRRCDMLTVLVDRYGCSPLTHNAHHLVDYHFATLAEFLDFYVQVTK